MLRRVDDASQRDGVLINVELQGDEVVVPDMDRLEQILVRHGVKVERVIG
jgi:hypothetical protein